MKKSVKILRLAGSISGLLLLGAFISGGYLMASMSSRSDMIPAGQMAPDFVAATSDGSSVHLADLVGQKRVVLVFYPGDYTPVCTAQLCAFRDNWQALQGENAVVYGINPAAKEKHSGFAVKNRLPFPLIVDTKGEIANHYGCRAIFGIVKRTVYVIDRNGKVAWVQRGNPAPSEILQVLRDLKDGI